MCLLELGDCVVQPTARGALTAEGAALIGDEQPDGPKTSTLAKRTSGQFVVVREQCSVVSPSHDATAWALSNTITNLILTGVASVP